MTHFASPASTDVDLDVGEEIADRIAKRSDLGGRGGIVGEVILGQ